jgi:hypothetical protein
MAAKLGSVAVQRHPVLARDIAAYFKALVIGGRMEVEHEHELPALKHDQLHSSKKQVRFEKRLLTNKPAFPNSSQHMHSSIDSCDENKVNDTKQPPNASNVSD